MENSKKLVAVPEEEDVVVCFAVTDDKPFNKCFECRSFRSGCSGPNLSVMGISRACEFLQMARIFLGYTYQEVSDGTDVSLATVKRILTGKVGNPDFFSISAISVFLLGDPSGKYPCAIPNTLSTPDNENKLNSALIELERALADNKDIRKSLDNIHATYNAEMQLIRDEAQKKVDFLLATVERLRNECAGWKYENDRKGKLIDTYMEKIISSK